MTVGAIDDSESKQAGVQQRLSFDSFGKIFKARQIE